MLRIEVVIQQQQPHPIPAHSPLPESEIVLKIPLLCNFSYLLLTFFCNCDLLLNIV